MNIRDIKAGMMDAVTMLKDKNPKPFIRPFLVLLGVIVIAWFLYKGTSNQIQDMRKRAEAQAAELENREEYLKNKNKYSKLIEELPPNNQKSTWHAKQIFAIRESLSLSDRALANGKEVQTKEGVFTISKIPIKAELTFDQIGRVVEAIENYPSFMRVSDLKISRKEVPDSDNRELLSVSFNTNTVFVEDKDFPTLTGGKK